MAPPVEIVKRTKVEEKLEAAEKRWKGKCLLKELTQFECHVREDEVVCVPFSRLFKQCGHRLYEITNESTND
jgi:hypothetical protein